EDDPAVEVPAQQTVRYVAVAVGGAERRPVSRPPGFRARSLLRIAPQRVAAAVHEKVRGEAVLARAVRADAGEEEDGPAPGVEPVDLGEERVEAVLARPADDARVVHATLEADRARREELALHGRIADPGEPQDVVDELLVGDGRPDLLDELRDVAAPVDLRHGRVGARVLGRDGSAGAVADTGYEH